MKKVHSVQPDNIYQLHDSVAAEKLYTQWADTYDNDLLVDMGWQGHIAVASRLKKLLSVETASILDVGCGTGLCGQSLFDHGLVNITGVDLTEAMIAQAREKQIYVALEICNATQALPFADATFDAVCSAGLFSHGPVLPKHLKHLLRPLKTGGISIHTINGLAFAKLDYRDTLDAMAQQGCIEMIDCQTIDYNVKTGVPGQLVIFRKLESNV